MIRTIRVSSTWAHLKPRSDRWVLVALILAGLLYAAGARAPGAYAAAGAVEQGPALTESTAAAPEAAPSSPPRKPDLPPPQFQNGR